MLPLLLTNPLPLSKLNVHVYVKVLNLTPAFESNHTTLYYTQLSSRTLLTQWAMGGESRYQIGQNAYIKLVLHALKHKTSAVNGLLLGRLSSGSDVVVVEITDSIPLFHSQIGLLPPLEIALIMVPLSLSIFSFIIYICMMFLILGFIDWLIWFCCYWNAL